MLATSSIAFGPRVMNEIWGSELDVSCWVSIIILEIEYGQIYNEVLTPQMPHTDTWASFAVGIALYMYAIHFWFGPPRFHCAPFTSPRLSNKLVSHEVASCIFHGTYHGIAHVCAYATSQEGHCEHAIELAFQHDSSK